LDGEGLTGILTQQGGTWFYKHNETPITRIIENETAKYQARFGAVKTVKSMPIGGLSGISSRQFLDLDGNGNLDLVEFSPPLSGFYQRNYKVGETENQNWETFRAFKSQPNINWNDPNLKFIDLNGDGHADILISEDQVFTWYPSLAEKGFAEHKKVAIPLDEEKGPYVIFADIKQTIVQADLSGDGLSDIARIRNGEICYWPNLGYGRFGAKVTMDKAPLFDHPDQFNPNRIRLTDIDGSGVIDIIYLGRNKTQFWFNQSGNSWGDAQLLKHFPTIDNIASVAAVDLLGNGTACLVWSSPLPNETNAPMRYIELMTEGKPHLLVRSKNNLGAETHIQYVPSTYFYLKDKQAGKPWITLLPFPVHVVEKVTVTDKWSGTQFSTSYSYHHGYFDGKEREFRGFGRVEQIDTESFGEFTEGNINSPYITDDHTLYQPPIKTVSWYHTGAMIDRAEILSHYKQEYFPQWLEDEATGTVNILGGFKEAELPEPAFEQQDLTAEETKEAHRACKGMVLRQEVYELEVDALAKGKHKPIKLFSTAYHNCHIQRLQAQGSNPYAVFLVTESEAISYQYELNLLTETLTPDPRISHSFNLKMDELGNVLQAIAVVYPRLGKHQDDSLDPQTIQLIQEVQQETHLAYSESHFTNDINTADNYRLRVPCEALSYELTGITPSNEYFTLKELQSFRLSLQYQLTGQTVSEIEYQQIADHNNPQKRIIEHSKILYFNDKASNSAEFLNSPLPFNEQGDLGLVYETYTLALTENLLDAVLAEKFTTTIKNELSDAAKSGYIKGTEIGASADQYWMRSGIAGFAEDAAEHFFLPERYTDPFNQTTTLSFDPLDLFIESSTDPIGNSSSVENFDYRVLAPRELKDINGNVTEMVFDVLGLPTAMAVKGKKVAGEWQGDNLNDFINNELILNPLQSDVVDFCTSITQDDVKARQWLGKASTRFIYHFGETLDAQGKEIWGTRMSGACSITREQHKVQNSPLQISLECSDGGGNVLMQKAQAEPDPENGNPRWIINGLTVLNNKGNPVKQYEPAFSDRFGCEMPQANGVTSVIYYDAAGQAIRTELPDGTYSKVEYSPWHVSSFDPNDTAFDNDPSKQSDWYQRRTNPAHPRFAEFNSQENTRAANLIKQHANTPTQVFLDSLGRDVISIEHNKFTDTDGNLKDEKYLSFSKLDAEGKPLWIRDARGNLVMQYIAPPKANNAADNSIPLSSVPCYDIAGNLLFQHSMDGGDRWMINDATGQPFYAWDKNENETGVLENRIYHTLYDKLRRPLEQQLQINNNLHVIERLVYGEGQANDKNLRGQLFQQYDSSGLVSNQQFDFKGNLLKVEQQLAVFSTDSVIHWPENPPQNMLEETYTQNIEYDALNRMTRQENWHRINREPAVYLPKYNQRGTLVSEELIVQGVTTEAIKNIEQDAKGQRRLIEYGNGTSTRYIYDKESLRLIQLRTTKTSPGEKLPTSPSNLKNDNVLQNLYYSYDPVGNITEIQDDAFKNLFFNNQQVEPRNQYQYDALYRLIKASGRENFHATNAPKAGKLADVQQLTFPITDQALRNYTQSYQYDSVGNFKKMIHAANGGSWTRHYKTAEDSNRLLKTWMGNNTADAINYKYDTHGSMLNLAKVPEKYQMQWDSNDMIHHIDLGGGGNVFYNYGSDKERSRKRIVRSNNTVEERIYLGGMEVFRKFNTAREIIEDIETYHLFDGEQRILMAEHVFKKGNTDLPENTTLYKYQYSNHLGSVGLEVDEVGAIISYEEYHPYGTTAYSARNKELKATKKRYKYTGMERDEESGLSYHSARYYLPWMGRWGSVDPAGLVDGGNLYGYVGGNPVLHVDTTGNQTESFKFLKGLDPAEFDPTGRFSVDDVLAFKAESAKRDQKKQNQEREKRAANRRHSKIPSRKSFKERFRMAKGRTETGQKNQARSVWKTGYGQFFYDDEKEKLFSHMSQISSESMENNQKKASMKAKREFIASANAAADTRWAIQMVLPTAIGGKIAKAYAGYEAVETGVNAVSCANGNALGCVGAVAGISPIFRGTISVSRTLVGTSRVGMKKAAAKLIGNTPNHPLKFLLTPDGKLKSAFRKKHFEMIEDPTLLEMGHVTSHKSGEAEFIVLQSGWTNQFDNKTVVSVN
jgi:RHS repeat-associated protein